MAEASVSGEFLAPKRARRPFALHSVVGIMLTALIGALLVSCGGDSTDIAEFCKRESEIDQAFETLGEDDAEAQTKLIDGLAAVGPDELKDDFDVVKDAFAVIADATKSLESADPEDAEEAFAAFEAAFENLDQERLDQAGDAIDKFTEENC